MRTCTFCLATNADDAPFCATCGRSGPPAQADATPTAAGAPFPGYPSPAAPPPLDPRLLPAPGYPSPPPPAGAALDPSVGYDAVWHATPGVAPVAPSDPPSKRGPLVLVLGATGAALLLLLAAYLGSIATPTPKSGLKQDRIHPALVAPVPPDGARGR